MLNIDRAGDFDLLGDLAISLVDRFVDPDFSKRLKKNEEAGKEKFF